MIHPRSQDRRAVRRSIEACILSLTLLAGTLLTGCDALTETEPPAPQRLSSTDAPAGASLTPSSITCVTGQQTSGAFYEICVPETGSSNGMLVVYAHGLVFPHKPLALPADEIDGLTASAYLTGQGFAYAATSYYTNGLVDPNKGLKDLRELITIYTRLYGQPEHVLLVGFSNGAFLSTLALEKHPGLFDGALASCGPIGSYRRAIDYHGDIFVVFKYFFPEIDQLLGVPVGGPEGISQTFLQRLRAAAEAAGITPEEYLGALLQSLLAHPANAGRTQQLLSVIQNTPAIDARFITPEEGIETVILAALYNVFMTNDTIEKLGGKPYDNTDRMYVGSLNDLALNSGIERFRADRNAVAQLEARYALKGHLQDDLVTLHNLRDPIVPFWQQDLYRDKLGGDLSHYLLVPISTYGHCAFEATEVIGAFNTLVGRLATQAAPAL